MSVLVLIVLFAVAGAALVVSGLYLLAGSGPALMLCGAIMFGAAAFLRSGMKPNA